MIGGSRDVGEGVLGNEPVPELSAVPVLMKEPFLSDISMVAGVINGCANIAVNAEVEVGTTPDFPIGTGSEGVFTGADGSDDNIATGVFRICCTGLVESVNYYWRVTLSNGADIIYYPSSTTTAGPLIPSGGGPFPSNPLTLAQVQDRPTNTDQALFLCSVSVETTYPLTLITSSSGIASFSNNNFRDSNTGEMYQTQPGDRYYLGAWGMWDDGSGMDFWYNNTNSGVYIGNPAPFAAVKTDKYVDPGQSATATGPVGTGGADVTITYDLTGYSSENEPSPLLPEPSPKPSTIPTLKVDPFVCDVASIAFGVVGVCDMAVDVEVEVGFTWDFPIGTGEVGVFTTSEDNYATGVFRVSCVGMMEFTTYHWRAAITNGADTIYYPSATTTEDMITGGSTVTGYSSSARVQARPTNTNQSQFLCVFSAATSYPLSRLTDSSGYASWVLVPLRDQTSGVQIHPGPSSNHYYGAWALWDDGSGLDFWYNNTNSGIYIGNPGTAQVKTDPENPPPPPPDEIEIFYSTDAGANWQLVGSDQALTGSYQWVCPAPGTYHWIANSVGGEDDVGIPAPGTPPEAGPYDYVGIPPGNWELYNGQNFVTFTNELTPGWTSAHLGEDIVAYINANYPETLLWEDIEIGMYDSVTGLYTWCWFSITFAWWMNVFPLAEGQCYIIFLYPGALIVQPRLYQLPNSPIVSPVTVDIYNGQNFRGFPVTNVTTSEELAVDIITYINTNYGEALINEDVSITTYDSVTGTYTTTYYFAPFTMWMNVFTLNPEVGYIITIAPGALSVQPRAYTPS